MLTRRVPQLWPRPRHLLSGAHSFFAVVQQFSIESGPQNTYYGNCPNEKRAIVGSKNFAGGLSMLKRFAIVVMNTLLALFTCANATGATISTHKAHSKTHRITEPATAQKKMTRMRNSSRPVASRNRDRKSTRLNSSHR